MANAFLLDLGRCIGCEACVVACKTGNELPEGLAYIEILERIRGTFPELSGGFDNLRCLHCSDAACVAVCPTGALFKEDGMTRLDRDASKCDGCADATKAGGVPWCVTTCPSRALEYGDRDEMLRVARSRAEGLRARYPNAQVYGETQAGGLGVILVLPDEPEAMGLPLDPEPPVISTAWQQVVQPVSIAAVGATAVAAGVAGVIARRNHMAELEELEAANGSTGEEN